MENHGLKQRAGRECLRAGLGGGGDPSSRRRGRSGGAGGGGRDAAGWHFCRFDDGFNDA